MERVMANKINLDVAKRVDITCRKGDTFVLDLAFSDSSGTAFDLTGYNWKLDVKETDTSSGDIIPETDFTYVGDVDGNLKVTATATAMSNVNGGLYVYDLQSNVGGIVTTWIYGVFQINEDISE
jgi:hypothetical protein